MNANQSSPNSPVSFDHADRLFGDFFKAQVPAKWSAPKPWATKAQPANRLASDPATRSRWALAASVALLVGGCWYLSGNLGNGKAKSGIGLEGGTADPSVMKKHFEKNPPAKVGMP